MLIARDRVSSISAVIAASVFVAAMAMPLGGCTRSKDESPNTLRVSSQAKIKGLDPLYADDIYSAGEVARGYEGLLRYHYLKRPYVLEGNLAETMPELSKDGLTYTFKIKKGVLFQDDPSFKETSGKGRELTAEDFIYSWKRLADPKNTSPGWWTLEGKIVGLDDWRAEASKSGTADYSKAVEGLKASDRYTLQIKLVKRSAQFLFNLAQQFSFVVAREAVEAYGKEFLNHSVGTGPFRLVEFNGNSKIIWARNPTFRQELYPSEGAPGDKEAGLLADAGKPIPFVDRIVLQVYEESQPMWLTFMSGKLDVASIPKDNFNQAVTPSKELSPDLKAKGIVLTKYPDLDVTFFSFNMTDPLVGKNKALRQAMSLAYDEAKYVETFYNGRAVAAQGPIPPGLAGYDENYKNPYRQFNVAKAKELLAKAGFPNGEGLDPIEYITMSDSTSRQGTEYAQQQFAQIGVKLKVSTFSWPEFQRNVKEKKGQLYFFAWTADYPDAENFLQMFYSKNASPGPNNSNYSNPEFDKLYEKSLTLQDTPERTALYKQMVALVVEDCPWIFGAHRLGYALTQGWLKNYKPNDLEPGRYKYYRVDAAAATAARK
jgi:oligopeptide transport system substrate-binding protein